MVFGALVSEKKRSKGTEKRERYTKLIVNFQRKARRDKKGFLSEQCKKIEEKQ